MKERLETTLQRSEYIKEHDQQVLDGPLPVVARGPCCRAAVQQQQQLFELCLHSVKAAK